MKFNRFLVPIGMCAMLSLAPPAGAQQQRRGEDHDGGQGAQPRESAQSGQRAQPRREAPPPAPAPPQQRQRAEQARGEQRGQPQAAQPRRGEAARGVYTTRDRDNDDRGYVNRGRREGYERPYVAPYRPYYYARPYYVFRPRIVIGYGVWSGYPVPYPYYGYPYPYYPQSEYDYPPPPPDSVEVAPDQSYGGLSFNISPEDGAVYVDSQYAGVVSDFSPNQQPLTVDPGEHRIEIDAPGYRPMVFDVDVIAGQVIPFQGNLQPY